ncbi:MAG: NAD-dependent epimerase/dehydratase family protein, partial [Candidatus Krumholzibacteriota bacterium]|nr:NAD-dependent epimerase/dehydratase family protein [Candidatus Krumholzibacteriota bacterium]
AGVVAIFSQAMLEGKPIRIFGDGEQTRDFTFVDDVVAANLAAMDYSGENKVFNVGGGSRVTINHVLDVIGEHIRRDLDIRYVERQRGDVTHTYADISLAAAELGYEPGVALEEGLAREMEWIRAVYRKLSSEESAA